MGRIITDKFDFASVTESQLPSIGSFIVGFDTADDLLKKLDSNGILTIIGDGSGPDIFVSDTFANIDILVSENSLEPGARYEITDPNGFPLGLNISPESLFYHTGSIILLATSENTFDSAGTLKAVYPNQDITEYDAIVYSYTGANIFTNIKRRSDKRGNDIYGNIDKFQWGNDSVINNKVDATSSLHLVDTASFAENAGDVWNNVLEQGSTLTAYTATSSSEIIENSLKNGQLDLSLNNSQANYNILDLGAIINASGNSGTFSHNIFEAQSSGDFSDNSATGTISNNKFCSDSTVTNNGGSISSNNFSINYILSASNLDGTITGNNFGSGGQTIFDGFQGNFTLSSVSGSGILDMSAYTETVGECKLTVNEYTFFANMLNDNGDQLLFNKVELVLNTYGYVEKGSIQFTTEDDSPHVVKSLYMSDGQVSTLDTHMVATKGTGTFPQSFAQTIHDFAYSKMSGLSGGDILQDIGNTNQIFNNYTDLSVIINNGNYSLDFTVAGDPSIPSAGIIDYTFTTTKFLSNA